jgi:hypothetical protein
MDDLQEQQNLKELYPQLSADEIRAAQLTLEQYFALAWEIYEESILSSDPLTVPEPEFYDAAKVDFPSTIN